MLGERAIVELSPGVPLAGVQALALGTDHSCALVSGGEVRCWGWNGSGQLGDGTIDQRPNPVPVQLSPGVRLTGAQALALGGAHGCALVSGGEVRCWGWNGSGQLGDGTVEQRVNSVPVELSPGVPLTGVQALALGTDHSCAVVKGGGLRCWGNNTNGQLGDGTTAQRQSPVSVELSPGVPLAGVQALALGTDHSCVVVSGGEVHCWGNNAYGQLGDSTTTLRLNPVPVQLSPGVLLTGAQALALGGNFSCALVSEGEVRCWGYNGAGQLGDGTRIDRVHPVLVTFSPGLRLRGVSGGMQWAALCAPYRVTRCSPATASATAKWALG
jgi:alpha-tubulin suppressor-like RCC1 family protein